MRAPAAATARPSSAAAPAGAAPKLLRVSCSRCRVRLELPQPGHYQCPRCLALLTLSAEGRVRFFAPTENKPVELTLPCRSELLPGLATLARLSAEAAGINGARAREVASAVEEVGDVLIREACADDPRQVLHVLLVPGQGELLIRFSDSGTTLDLGGRELRSDGRFPRAARVMDHLEHKPGSPTGNLISLVKRQKDAAGPAEAKKTVPPADKRKAGEASA
jgi:hypothetical protein